MRALERFVSRPSQTRQCEVCASWTVLGKPYCVEHVLEHPYAAGVQAGWRDMVARVCVELRAGATIADLPPDLREVYFSGTHVGGPWGDPEIVAATLEAMWLS